MLWYSFHLYPILSIFVNNIFRGNCFIAENPIVFGERRVR